MLNPVGIEGAIVRMLGPAAKAAGASAAAAFSGLMKVQADVAGVPSSEAVQNAMENGGSSALDPNLLALLAFIAALVGALIGAAIVRRFQNSGSNQEQQKGAQQKS